MKCEKCGFHNSEYDIICEKCGYPLNIENNLELQKKYNHKQMAIDIERIEPDTKEKTFEAIRKKVLWVLLVLVILIIALLIMIFSNIINNVKSREIINKVDSFVQENKDGIIYLGKDKKASELLYEYSDEYEYNYLFVDTSKITSVKKNKLKNKFKVNEINNTIIILKDEQVKQYINNFKYNSKDDALLFLQENGVLPKYLDNPNNIINKFDEAIVSEEPSIIYYVSDKKTKYDRVNDILQKLANNNSLNYSFIEGYYLTGIQQLKLLKKLNYSGYHEEVLIIVDEGKIKGTIEKPSDDSTTDYFAIMTNYGIIDTSSAQRLVLLNNEKLINTVKLKEKNVILIGNNNCQYCDRVKPILGKISMQNDLTFYYYQIIDEAALIKYLKLLGYQDDTISLPLVLITENNTIIDRVVGYSDKTFYEEKFKELGVIR